MSISVLAVSKSACISWSTFTKYRRDPLRIYFLRGLSDELVVWLLVINWFFFCIFKTRIQRECSRKVSPNTANTVAHMIGLAFFIGDLFVQSSSDELGEALPNLLMNLTGSNVTFLDENCKCVCRVLKVSGFHWLCSFFTYNFLIFFIFSYDIALW